MNWSGALKRGGQPRYAPSVVIDDFAVDPVTKRLVILRQLIVLIFHRSIIPRGHGARVGRPGSFAGSLILHTSRAPNSG